MLFGNTIYIFLIISFGLATKDKTYSNIFFPPNIMLVGKLGGFPNIGEKDIPILRRQYASYYTVVSVETSLRLFIRRLRDFLLRGIFDFTKLEAYAAEFSQEFKMLDIQAETITAFRDIKNQRKEVKNLLEAMHGSINHLKYCECSKAGSSYICKVIELHLKFMALVDSIEPGHPRYGDYETDFLLLWWALSNLEDGFKTLVDVDSEETEVFQKYLSPAKRILHKMGTSIPGYSK